ncbi:MAG TPA: hypothetical protein VF253_13110 [Candidatus Limnocylindrales bacterium]
MRARRIAVIVGILGALVAAPSASAAPPVQTRITIDVNFDTDEEFFWATGGVVCASGTATTEGFARFGGRKNQGTFTFHIVKTMTCADDKGTFKLLVDAATSPNSPGTIGGFAVGDGTGDMAGIRGGGHLVGTAYEVGNGIVDLYTGNLTIAP